MALKFQGKIIPGTHESPRLEPPRLQVKRTDFSGVKGESEIIQERKGRAITIPIMIHGKFKNSDALVAFLKKLDEGVGKHGELEIVDGPTPGVPALYKYCTFEGFRRNADSQSGPLPDYTGLLDGVTPSWWVHGTLQWYQLQVS